VRPPRFVDLSLPIEDGMPTYPGLLPEARIGAAMTHEETRPRYEGKAQFYLGKIEIPGNTGTYIDVPFHRFPDREDIAAVGLDRLAGLPGMLIDAPAENEAVDLPLQPADLAGRAVLVRTGWDRRWGSDAYWEPDPYLSELAVEILVTGGAALVGVDWNNVDDTTDPARPVHTRLLQEGILIVERLAGMDELPGSGFRFFAVPPRIVGGASFPVRAFAELA
jgi:kynurenine formamidase